MNLDSIVVVSAASFEIAPLIEKFTNLKFIHCGIGSFQASYAAAVSQQDLTNKDIIFVGTCGTFNNFTGIELISIKDTLWMDAGERLGSSVSIENLYPQLKLKNYTFDGLKTKTAITSSALSQSNEIHEKWRTLLAKENLVENLELYPFYYYVRKIVRSFSAVLAITNELSPLGRGQWKNNFKQAAHLTGDYLSDYLKQSINENKMEAPSGFEPL